MHKIFGVGTIVRSDISSGDEEVVVEFRDGSGRRVEKRLDTSLAPLERI